MNKKVVIHKTSGVAAAASLAALLIKYPLRKLGFNKANAVMMQAHEAASGTYFLASLVHMATGKTASRFKTFSGAAAFATSVVLIADCHIAKDQKKKMQRHRAYSAVLTACTAMHIFSRTK